MAHSLRPVRAVIYDMDGLLLDTEVFYTEVTQQIVGRFGKTFDWSVKSKMIGRPAIDSAHVLVQALGLPIKPEQYLEEREQLLAERFPQAQAKPGAERLVRHLAKKRVPQAVATSSNRFFFDLKTQFHDWFDLFDKVVTVDNPAVKHGKPAPDIFLVAAEQLQADPSECLVFEDAPSGLQAALAAQMAVVVVPDPNMDRAHYQAAHQVLSSIDDFDPVLWSLPGYAD